MIIYYVLLGALVSIGIGALFVCRLRAHRQRQLDPRLIITWQTRQAATRLDAAFWAARQAMQREAKKRRF